MGARRLIARFPRGAKMARGVASSVECMKAIIVGGGVGGLVTALMLHARGIDCEVYEQADGIRELGVGINTLPHAIKELKELGLLERLDAVAIRTYELFYLNRFGQEIWRELRGTDAGLRRAAILDPSRRACRA